MELNFSGRIRDIETKLKEGNQLQKKPKDLMRAIGMYVKFQKPAIYLHKFIIRIIMDAWLYPNSQCYFFIFSPLIVYNAACPPLQVRLKKPIGILTLWKRKSRKISSAEEWRHRRRKCRNGIDSNLMIRYGMVPILDECGRLDTYLRRILYLLLIIIVGSVISFPHSPIK